MQQAPKQACKAKNLIAQKTKKDLQRMLQIPVLSVSTLVAGAGFEPTTFGL